FLEIWLQLSGGHLVDFPKLDVFVDREEPRFDRPIFRQDHRIQVVMSREALGETNIDRLERVFPPLIIDGVVPLSALEPVELQDKQSLKELPTVVLEDVIDAVSGRHGLELANKWEQAVELGELFQWGGRPGTRQPANQVRSIDFEGRCQSKQRVEADGAL